MMIIDNRPDMENDLPRWLLYEHEDAKGMLRMPTRFSTHLSKNRYVIDAIFIDHVESHLYLN